jgi:hypothetical protein
MIEAQFPYSTKVCKLTLMYTRAKASIKLIVNSSIKDFLESKVVIFLFFDTGFNTSINWPLTIS